MIIGPPLKFHDQRDILVQGVEACDDLVGVVRYPGYELVKVTSSLGG
jgi:hypothetical protein